MSFGVMGGQFQAVGGHAYILSEMFDRGRDVQAANAAPRRFAFGDNLQLETTHSQATFDRLPSMGHRVSWADEPIGV
ncbi:gamma-glutamyltransferase [Ensifer adhaerens]